MTTSTLQNLGPLLTAEGHAPTSERLARQARAGRLVRLANGVYCPTESWLRTPPWDRHLLRVVAVARSRRLDAVFCRETAVLVHGLPLASTPREIHVRVASRGRSRRTAAPSPYLDVRRAAQVRDGLRKAGIRLSTTRLPVLPPIRGHWAPPGTASETPPELHPVVLSSGLFVGSVLVEPLPRACADLFAARSLVDAIPTADALLRRSPAAVLEIRGTLDDSRLPTRRRLHAGSILDFADPRSESPKESVSRALIHELGFEAPTLQHRVFDEHGRELSRGDFHWRRSTLRPRQLLGEFDGMWKYGVDLAGPDGGVLALEREKRRELELARRGYDTVRWIHDDLLDPERFGRVLAEQGVPRR